MGALSAWRLAARGARVIGFERFRPGHDRGSSHGDTRIFRTAYFESPEYVPLLQRAHRLWRQLEKESGPELLTMAGGRGPRLPAWQTAPGRWPGPARRVTVEGQVVAGFPAEDPSAFAPERFPVFIRGLADGRFRYGVPTTDSRSIKVGVHHEGGDADPDSMERTVGDEDLRPLREFVSEYLRGVTTNAVDASVCMYTNTPDERFLAASPDHLPGVTVLSACSGHGFKFASVLGELMAELILDGRALPGIIRTA